MIRFADTEPHFAAGDIVSHRSYGYRGVVVAVDPRCLADHEWYMSNRTHPDQNQPWYHVLVDGSATVTYAAESNLASDTSGEPIDHPLLREFFGAFQGERYERNTRPWKGW